MEGEEEEVGGTLKLITMATNESSFIFLVLIMQKCVYRFRISLILGKIN